MDVLIGEVSLSCLFKSCRGGEEWVFSKIYCRGNKEERELLWKELYICKMKWGCYWVVGGDFNMIMKREESSGNFESQTGVDFVEAVEELGLADLPLLESHGLGQIRGSILLVSESIDFSFLLFFFSFLV